MIFSGFKWDMRFSLRRSLIATATFSGVNLLTSFAISIAISYHLGASAELDAYWAAFALMNLLAFPLAPLREALVPEFHRRLQQDREVASTYFSGAMTLILLIAAAGMLVGWLFAEPLAALAVSSEQSQMRTLAATQLYWLAPAILFLAVSETLNAILAAYHRVILQSIARLLGAFSTLAVLVLFSGALHSHVLPLAFISAQVVVALVQALALRRYGLAFRLVWPRALGRRFVTVSGALLASYAAGQAYTVFEKHTLTSFAPGLVSSFQYAVSLTNTIIALIGVAFANVVWPRFMKHVSSGDRNRLYVEVSMASRFTLLVTGWLCATAWLNATALIELIYARGAFNEAAVVHTADALRLAVFAAVPISVGLIIGRALISLGAARSVAATGFAMAFAGSTTLTVANLIGNSTLALSHWLLANVVGLVVQAGLFAHVCGGFQRTCISALWWVGRWLVVLTLAGAATQMIPAAQPGLAFRVGDIFVRSVAFSMLFAVLVWGGGLMRGLPLSPRR